MTPSVVRFASEDMRCSPQVTIPGEVVGLRHSGDGGCDGPFVDAVFLTSIFVQSVLGYSALSDGMAVVPMAAALVKGARVADT